MTRIEATSGWVSSSESMVSSSCSRAATSRPGGRLVEQQQPRFRDQCARNESAAALTLRQRRPDVVGLAGQPDRCDHRVGAVAFVGRWASSASGVSIVAVMPVSTTSRTVSGYCSRCRGIHVSDRMTQPRQVDAAHLLAEDVHGSRGGKRHRGAETEQRALARAVGAEQRPVLAGVARSARCRR